MRTTNGGGRGPRVSSWHQPARFRLPMRLPRGTCNLQPATATCHRACAARQSMAESSHRPRPSAARRCQLHYKEVRYAAHQLKSRLLLVDFVWCTGRLAGKHHHWPQQPAGLHHEHDCRRRRRLYRRRDLWLDHRPYAGSRLEPHCARRLGAREPWRSWRSSTSSPATADTIPESRFLNETGLPVNLQPDTPPGSQPCTPFTSA